MLWFLFVLFVFGIVFGAIARLLVPGPDPMGILGTWALGVVGSFIGGFLGYLIFDVDTGDGAIQVAGVVGSIVGSVITLVIYNAVTGRKRALR